MQKKILPTTTSRRTTERKRTEDNETEQRRDERVVLDRVFDGLGGLSGRPSGRPVSDPPKTAPDAPGLARSGNGTKSTNLLLRSHMAVEYIQNLGFGLPGSSALGPPRTDPFATHWARLTTSRLQTCLVSRGSLTNPYLNLSREDASCAR